MRRDRTSMETSCIKRQYRNRIDAELVAANAWAKHQTDLRAYLCLWCHFWHLTSQRKRK